MKYNTVVVSSFSKFCKVFARLYGPSQDRLKGHYFRAIETSSLEEHDPNTVPAVHRPDSSQELQIPTWKVR